MKLRLKKIEFQKKNLVKKDQGSIKKNIKKKPQANSGELY